MDIIDEIKADKKCFLYKNYTPSIRVCIKCNGEPEMFKIHEVKPRLFYVLITNIVNEIWSMLARLKCPICKKTFIEYPNYAQPYKRYVKQNLLAMSELYLNDNDGTYLKATGTGGFKHVNESEQQTDSPVLAASTLWRWLSYISGLTNILSNGFELIKQKSPLSEIHRETYPIPPKKIRSRNQEKKLQQCLKFLKMKKEFRYLYGHSIFPDFATEVDFS